jgi:hypothetical protein
VNTGYNLNSSYAAPQSQSSQWSPLPQYQPPNAGYPGPTSYHSSHSEYASLTPYGASQGYPGQYVGVQPQFAVPALRSALMVGASEVDGEGQFQYITPTITPAQPPVVTRNQYPPPAGTSSWLAQPPQVPARSFRPSLPPHPDRRSGRDHDYGLYSSYAGAEDEVEPPGPARQIGSSFSRWRILPNTSTPASQSYNTRLLADRDDGRSSRSVLEDTGKLHRSLQIYLGSQLKYLQ